MKRYFVIMVSVVVIGFMIVSVASAEGTLDRIAKRGEFLVGAREGSVPFGFYDKDGKWGGFSMDIAKEIHKAVEKKIEAGKVRQAHLQARQPQDANSPGCQPNH
jgi:ABC-type amino acid transport substrate-binding protein